MQIGCCERRRLLLCPPASLDQDGCLVLLSLLASGRTAAQLRAEAQSLGARPGTADELVLQVRAAGLLVRRGQSAPRGSMCTAAARSPRGFAALLKRAEPV